MNVNLLIDAIVRQTTVLIAALATAGGSRAPLAHVADQVFAHLVRELKDQGLGNKVIADMFGLALRTYHNQVSRLSESRTCLGRSLWEAVLSYLQDQGVVLRVDVLKRFRRDDEALVKAVLNDLVSSGLVFVSGRGSNVTYRAAAPDDMPASHEARQDEARANLVLVAVHRYGPIGRSALSEIVPMADALLDRAIEQLVADGRATAEDRDGAIQYKCANILIPFGDPGGWEAAVFDHYQAMVTAICAKLRRRANQADLGETVGGSTYSFDVWNGHPFAGEALGFLRTMRERARDLRERIEAYNAAHQPLQGHSQKRVIAYVGQTVLADEDNSDE